MARVMQVDKELETEILTFNFKTFLGQILTCLICLTFMHIKKYFIPTYVHKFVVISHVLCVQTRINMMNVNLYLLTKND